jgi:hypothetical protein
MTHYDNLETCSADARRTATLNAQLAKTGAGGPLPTCRTCKAAGPVQPELSERQAKTPLRRRDARRHGMCFPVARPDGEPGGLPTTGGDKVHACGDRAGKADTVQNWLSPDPPA